MRAMSAVQPAEAAAALGAERLKLTEIFLSLQGEARDAGWPTVFVRLTGCPLRCQYCDTTYAFFGGEWREIDSILEEVAKHGVRHVCVTGGEPLAQKRVIGLLSKLCDAGYVVSLETSGAIDIGDVDTRVSRIVDIKTPGSGEVARNLWDNIALLTPHDQVKFVICDRADYEWAREVIRKEELPSRVGAVLISPVHGDPKLPRDIAAWLLADKLPARLQLQLHKVVWDPGERRR